jgi:hypothetical protein
VLEQILTGSFEGNSEAYKHYTEAAENVEKQKMNTPSVVVMTSEVKTLSFNFCTELFSAFG